MPRRILVVDDDAGSVRALAKLLDGAGFEVQTARSRSQALSEVARRPCDVLITDLGLPDGSAIELLRDLRAISRAIPGIVVSGENDSESAALCRAAGFSEYMLKPVLFADLVAVIRDIEEADERD